MIETTTEVPEQLPRIVDLHKAIAKAIAETVPEGRTGAVFAIADSETKTIRFGAAWKFGDHWEVEGDLGSGIHGEHVTGRVMVAGSW